MSLLGKLAEHKQLELEAAARVLNSGNESHEPNTLNSEPISNVYEEPTREEMERELLPKAKYTPLEFKDPVELLYCFSLPVIEKAIELHKWQIQELLRVTELEVSPQKRLQYMLLANNGSGKDSYFIMPLAVFQCACKVRSRTIITSASFPQLSLQTESYIRSFCQAVNTSLKEQGICDKAFLIKRQHIVCTLTGSEIVLFVTDEGGRAEGYHPFPDYPKGEVTIILNEAKTVPDVIYDSLGRCTYSRWLEVSSAGNITGKFYAHYKYARHYPEEYKSGERYCRRVTSYDCAHISQETIKQDERELGLNNPVFRSKHLSLFTSLNEQVVITRELMEQCKENPPDKLIGLKLGRRAGLDLAAGGDENALYVFDENICVGSEIFRATDTAEVTIPVLIKFFKKWQLSPLSIYGDDGGVGHAIIDGLRREGWPINIVRNQSAALRKGEYGNRGAELWFNFGLFVQYLNLPLKEDEKLFNQLCSRYYTQHARLGKIILESKKEARAKGHGSPDRADACILAFTGITINDFMDALGKGVVKVKDDRQLVRRDKISVAYKELEKSRKLPSYFDEDRQEIKKEAARLNPVNLIRSLY